MSRHVAIPDHVKTARPWAQVRDVGPPPDSRGDIGTAEMQISARPGEYRSWYAHFTPTRSELAALNAGGTIEMCQIGHAPMAFSVCCWAPAPEASARRSRPDSLAARREQVADRLHDLFCSSSESVLACTGSCWAVADEVITGLPLSAPDSGG